MFRLLMNSRRIYGQRKVRVPYKEQYESRDNENEVSKIVKPKAELSISERLIQIKIRLLGI